MKTLIVTAHPDPDSLTAGIAEQLRAALATDAVDATGDAEVDADSSVEVADLAAEGFDPRFGAADRNTYRVGGEFPDDVAREHRRLDAADHLVLVFPVWWWSMPALLKGWVDRVFVNGWAFDVDPDGVETDRDAVAVLTDHLGVPLRVLQSGGAQVDPGAPGGQRRPQRVVVADAADGATTTVRG